MMARFGESEKEREPQVADVGPKAGGDGCVGHNRFHEECLP